MRRMTPAARSSRLTAWHWAGSSPSPKASVGQPGMTRPEPARRGYHAR